MTAAAHSFPSFVARAPWWGGDLQTLRNLIHADAAAARVSGAQRLTLAMADGTGDSLLAAYNAPAASAPSRPLIVLIHGLTGCETSSYVLRSAANLLHRGYPVLRLNLRGAGPSRPLCREQYHAGRSDDLRQALARIADQVPAARQAGLFLVGYSLGGNMLLKFLAEQGADDQIAGMRIRGAASVSAPIDLASAANRMLRPRNLVYQHYLLRRMKQEALSAPGRLDCAQRKAILGARTVIGFDDAYAAPRNGFASGADYYARSSALPRLGGVRVPTLVIHALNDPWIPGDAYRAVDWAGNPALVPLLPRGGGHVGFHANGATTEPWHDLCVARFLERLG